MRNENSKYLKIITDTSVIVCDEIIDMLLHCTHRFFNDQNAINNY